RLLRSKRKENAQEVEFVPVYNKRLRKSFIRAHDVYKSTSSRSHTTTSNKHSSDEFEPSARSFASSNIAPTPFNFEASAGPESVPVISAKKSRKQKQGKVRVDTSFMLCIH